MTGGLYLAGNALILCKKGGVALHIWRRIWQLRNLHRRQYRLQKAQSIAKNSPAESYRDANRIGYHQGLLECCPKSMTCRTTGCKALDFRCTCGEFTSPLAWHVKWADANGKLCVVDHSNAASFHGFKESQTQLEDMNVTIGAQAILIRNV